MPIVYIHVFIHVEILRFIIASYTGELFQLRLTGVKCTEWVVRSLEQLYQFWL